MWCRENAGECTGRCPARLRKRLEKKGKWRQRPGEVLIRSLFLRGTEDSHCTRRAGQTRRITNSVGPDALVRVASEARLFCPFSGTLSSPKPAELHSAGRAGLPVPTWPREGS